MPNKNFFVLFFLILLQVGTAQKTVFGKWKTIDDRNGVEKAIIKIYEKDGLMYGEVHEILEEGKKDAVCSKCDGERKNAPVLGMEIITAAKKSDKNEYKGKRLFDPEQAMTFRCKIWLDEDDDDKLKVRGYLAFIFRTQTWIRVKE